MSDVKSWETICEAGDIKAGLGVRALLGEVDVAVFRLADKLYAIDAIDPFTKMPVLARGLVGDLKGQVVVASPIYKQHFNLESGQCLEDETVKLNTFPVREQAGQVQLGHI